jgi:hypothetical protein
MKLESDPGISLVLTMIAIKQKAKATDCSDHCTITLITHRTEIVARIGGRRIKGKLRMFVEKISVDLEEKKELGMQLRC